MATKTPFLDNILDEFGEEPGFDPQPWYNQYGDCVVFHASEEEAYADRIDLILTLYRSVETDEVIGFQVKGVRAIVELSGFNGFAISTKTKDGNVNEISISLLLIAAACKGGTGDAERRIKAYAEAANMAGEKKVRLTAA